MYKSLLMREVELIPNSCIQEDFMVVVVVLKGIVQFFDALFVVNIVAGNVTNSKRAHSAFIISSGTYPSIIPSPLLKPPLLMEVLKDWKCWSKKYAIK